MEFYTQIFISIFIIFPYFIFTTEFYSEFNEILKNIFNKELQQYVFIIIISLYFTIYIVCLILGAAKFIIFNFISGLFTLCNSAIFYKPSTIGTKNEYLEYFPHLEVIYAFFVGIYFIIHDILLIIKKIKNKNYYNFNDNYINIIDDSSFLNANYKQMKNRFDNISCEITKSTLKELSFYILTHKLDKLVKNCYVINFSKNDFNIDYIDNSLIINIGDMTISYDKEFMNIKEFKGQINFVKNKIKINVIEKGVIEHKQSIFKNIFLKVLYNLFNGIAVSKTENIINKKIEKFNIKKDIFDINIFVQEINITDEFLKINFNLLIDIND